MLTLTVAISVEWAAEDSAGEDPGGAAGGCGTIAEQGPPSETYSPAAVAHQILQVGRTR